MSPRAYRRVTLLALVALFVIVVSGGAVRLTGSGLGCPDWPTCTDGQLVAPWEYHAMVEWVNRMVTGVVSVAVILAVLGSLWRRPPRRDLTRLSLGLVAGVVGQIVLGGLTVLFDLAPPFVMGHFLLSMVLLWNAVVLHVRAGRPDDDPAPPGDPGLTRMARLLVAATALAVVLGTVVTGSGPHGGDETAPRFDFELAEVTRLHGIAVAVLLGLVLYTVAGLVRSGAPVALVRRVEVLLAVLVAQAVVGYVQYFTDVPALLVGVHIAGAAAVWVSVVWFHCTVGESRAWQRRPLLSSSTSPASTMSSSLTAPGS
ncbi:MAG TPA: COX15/CtaA family protein [Acidimicrobiales bacterium]|nr:COX15/CtaA family protein [Acidimicrobiales bacterium]